MARWEIRLCGRVAVSNSDGLTAPALPGRQGQLLLAYLVCHRTRACPRYELEDVLWPKDAPASSDSALSALLSKLRRALGPGALTIEKSTTSRGRCGHGHARCTTPRWRM